MIYDLVEVAIGLVILLVAGDLLVRGAVDLALRLGIPALVVGLTVVAFGTSAPELLVSIKAILGGAPGLALGNVVGSNIANVALVLGVAALISRFHADRVYVMQSYLSMLAGSALFMALAFTGHFVWWSGLILLAGLVATLVLSYHAANGSRSAEPPDERARPDVPGWRIAVFLVGGLVGLPLGANYLVEGAVAVARDFGVSEAVIGLTLIAVGTSLPELATTVMAALRRSADVAIGNVVGSNIFNLLGIMGIASLFGEIPVEPRFLAFDLWVMLATSLALIPFVLLHRDIGRKTGLLFVAAYVAYLTSLVL
jgi:cation:H+ antiporter